MHSPPSFAARPKASATAGRLAAVVLLIVGLLTFFPTPTSAHGELVASSPSPGENVGSVAHIDLVFSTPVMDWTLTVDRPDGETLPGSAVEKASSYLSYEVPPVTDEGQYIVRYFAIDTDGDVIEGAYAFTVEAGAPLPAELPVDLSVLMEDEGWPWWNYALLFVGVVIIAALAGLLAEKIRRLRVLQATR